MFAVRERRTLIDFIINSLQNNIPQHYFFSFSDFMTLFIIYHHQPTGGLSQDTPDEELFKIDPLSLRYVIPL